MMRRVLVALDESSRAPGVFHRALELSQASGAELLLFRAVDVIQEFPAAGAGGPADTLTAELVRAAHEELLKYAATAAEHPSRVLVEVDAAADHAVLAASEAHDVDLIVIGNHGYHGVDRILGTTAGRIIHRAKRDVLIVYRGGRE
jgi:nucleotide-binding universal stress UspA family protein